MMRSFGSAGAVLLTPAALRQRVLLQHHRVLALRARVGDADESLATVLIARGLREGTGQASRARVGRGQAQWQLAAQAVGTSLAVALAVGTQALAVAPAVALAATPMVPGRLRHSPIKLIALQN
jgi:hypothetical protein